MSDSKTNLLYFRGVNPEQVKQYEENNRLAKENSQKEILEIAQETMATIEELAKIAEETGTKTYIDEVFQKTDSILYLKKGLEFKESVFEEMERIFETSSLHTDAANNTNLFDQIIIIGQALEGLKKNLKISIGAIDTNPSSHENELKLIHTPKREPHVEDLYNILFKTEIKDNGETQTDYDMLSVFELGMLLYKDDKSKDPKWTIGEALCFVLDIADEEFRQELEFDKKAYLENRSNTITENENGFEVLSFEKFKADQNIQNQYRELKKELGNKYSNINGIILKKDFEAEVLNYIEEHQDKFHDDELYGSPMKILFSLSADAKKGQAQRLYPK